MSAHSEQIERLRFIKRLVDEHGVNLAGVQQLLSVVDIVERIRPLVRTNDGTRSDRRRALQREVDELTRLLGL